MRNRTIVPLSYWKQKHGNDHQVAYVGNVAWAHLCGMKSLLDRPDTCGGEAFFVTDDTPIGTYNAICEPFVNAMGCRYTKVRVPCRLVLPILFLLEIFLTLLKPIVEFNLPLTMKTLYMVNINLTFNRRKLEERCGYFPIYSYQESFQRSLSYYKRIYGS